MENKKEKLPLFFLLIKKTKELTAFRRIQAMYRKKNFLSVEMTIFGLIFLLGSRRRNTHSNQRQQNKGNTVKMGHLFSAW